MPDRRFLIRKCPNRSASDTTLPAQPIASRVAPFAAVRVATAVRLTRGRAGRRVGCMGVRLQKFVLNPLDEAAFALRIPPPGDALLETAGRRTGQPRVTPVCDCLEGETFWIIAQAGHGSDYVQNIEANPRVRVKGSLSSRDWRTGTAHILDDDDPEERVRVLSRGNRWRRLCLQASASFGTSPLTVRVDLDP